jgi:DNA polymerase-4
MPRFIMFVDINCCFASLEQQANPFWRGIPMGVVRKPKLWSVISAPSFEAKKRGVDTAMTTGDAWEICPEMLIVHEDADKYRYWSGKFWELLKSFTPLVEVFSVDEAFADITQLVRDNGGDPVAIAREYKQKLTKMAGEWITCSIGIANSKVMAKLAGESQKRPDSLVWIKDDEIEDWRRRTPVEAACGIADGWKERLSHFGITRMGDVTDEMVLRLQRRYKKPGLMAGWICQGKDPEPLKQNKHKERRKAYGNVREISRPHPNFEEVTGWLKILCHEAAIRMRADGVCGKTIHFFGSDPAGYGASKQYSLQHPTANELTIFETCVHIAKLIGKDLPYHFNGIGVGITNLACQSAQTISLFHDDQRWMHIMKTLDKINAEWGPLSVYPGFLQEAKAITPMFKANQSMHKDIEDEPEFDEQAEETEMMDVLWELYEMPDENILEEAEELMYIS